MPRSGIKGNKGRSDPKLVSSDMTTLLEADREMALANPDSPEVNKKSLRLVLGREAISENLIRVGDLINSELHDRTMLKNETAVDLDDVNAVMERTRDYFYACASAKNPPSMLTYSSIGLGLTLVRLNEYIRQHNNASTEFLLRVKDLIADQISTGALFGNLDNIMAIFQLKNLHGFADNVRVEAAVSAQAPQIDESALAAEYAKYAKENGIEI